MLNRIKNRLLHRSADVQLEEINKLRRMIGTQPRKTPGNVCVLGWNINYVDNLALLSSLDILVYKGWNDFLTKSKSPLILDCGANIGISVLNYKRKHPRARIIAFEPDPQYLPFLKKNMMNNHIEDVKVIEAAVWTESAELDFFMEGADGSRLTEHPSEASTKVKTVDLLDYMNEPIELIKMDIEGAEYEVIQHITKKLVLVNNLIVECHMNSNQAGKLGNLLENLSDAEFEVSINSMGSWRDLIRKPEKLMHEFDNYFLIAAWRK